MSELAGRSTMRFESLQDWLAWQETLNPKHVDLGLQRIIPIADRLGLRATTQPSIVIAGTNGKGSCAAFLDSIYRAAGYRVGVYTSPHLVAYNERIARLGQPATDAEICAAFAAVDAERADTPLTYFEFGTLAALQLFASYDLDVRILEVGMGGRLDAVNVVDADCALITSISVDHDAWLGTDRATVAAEKAPIMRHDRPAVFAEINAPAALFDYAAKVAARVVAAGRDFWMRNASDRWFWEDRSGLKLELPLPGLPGAHQLENAAGAVATVRQMVSVLPVPDSAMAAGIAQARVRGRLSRVGGTVETLLDVAHNPAGADVLAQYLREVAVQGRTRAVFGMMRDKRHREVIQSILDQIETWYVCDLPDPRAISGAELAQAVQAVSGSPAQCHANVQDAYGTCRSNSSPGDRIVVFGSFVTVAEALSRVPELAQLTEPRHG